MQGRGRGAARGRSARGGRGRKQQHMSSTTSSSDMNNSNKGTGGTNSRRRQSQKPGRGNGRHNRSNIARGGTSNQQANHNKPINIETTNFQSIFHNKLCRAAKYKVHAPQCSCPKVVKLRQRYENTQNKVKTNNETAIESQSGGYSNDQMQFDVDGSITHQLSQLDITSPNNSNDDTNHPFDNLIVLPDTKGSNPSIYSCTNTNLLAFQKDGIECEQKLAIEIFGNASTTTDKVHSTNNKKIPPFKVNCAICLLTTHQRNGFVAIISNSYDELQSTIQSARKSILDKQSNGKKLHADHAHFVCALKLSSLYSLLSAGKTRSKNEVVTKDILLQIRNDKGVGCLSSEMTNESTTSVQILMGHHLTSLLWLLQDDKQKSSNNVKYIMTMGYIDSSHAIELDLPGGKRHLGETTLQGVIREVEEECSLQIDYDWLVGRVSRRYGGSIAATREEEGGSIQVLEPKKVKGSVSGDAFFVMSPPPDTS